MQAVFNKASASNRWTIEATTLRQYAEYFGPRTEQLDIFYDQDQITMTSYTEKVVHGKGIERRAKSSCVC